MPEVVLHPHAVTGCGHDSFNVVDAMMFPRTGVFKDDHFAPFGRSPSAQADFREWYTNAVNELGDKDVITHHKGRNHGAGGDLEGFEQKRSDEQRDQQGRHNGFSALEPLGCR